MRGNAMYGLYIYARKKAVRVPMTEVSNLSNEIDALVRLCLYITMGPTTKVL